MTLALVNDITRDASCPNGYVIMATAISTLNVTPFRLEIEAALGTPSRRGDSRAFALGEITCVLRWRSAGTMPVSGDYFLVDLRLQREGRFLERSTTLSDLALLPRWCEHHVHCFASDEPVMSRTPSRPAPLRPHLASPTDMLRARLLADSKR